MNHRGAGWSRRDKQTAEPFHPAFCRAEFGEASAGLAEQTEIGIVARGTRKGGENQLGCAGLATFTTVTSLRVVLILRFCREVTASKDANAQQTRPIPQEFDRAFNFK